MVPANTGRKTENFPQPGPKPTTLMFLWPAWIGEWLVVAHTSTASASQRNTASSLSSVRGSAWFRWLRNMPQLCNMHHWCKNQIFLQLLD